MSQNTITKLVVSAILLKIIIFADYILFAFKKNSH